MRKCEAKTTLVWAEKKQSVAVVRQMMAEVEKEVAAIVSRLCHANTKASMEASFALEGLVMYAMAPSRAKQRVHLAEALAAALPAAKDDTSLDILLAALQKLAVPSAVAAVASCLKKDEPVFTYAVNALRTIGTREAYVALAKCAYSHRRPECRLSALLAALEEPSPAASVQKEALRLAEEEGKDAAEIRAALARRGCWEAFPLYMDSLAAARTRTERAVAMRMLASFFRKTDAPQEMKQAYAMEFLQNCPGTVSVATLVDACGENENSLQVLLAAFRQGDDILRSEVADFLAQGFDGAAFTEKLVAFAQTLDAPDAQAACLQMLGRRGDRAAAVYVRSRLWDRDASVRIAAWNAAKSWESGSTAVLAAGKLA